MLELTDKIKIDPFRRRCALITGVNGQDGYYLSEWLFRKGYEVYGISRSLTQIPTDMKDWLTGIFCVDLTEPQGLAEFVRRVQPHEVYHLAAHHFSSQNNENCTGQLNPFVAVNLLAPNIILEVLRYEFPQSRFFYAASPHVFGLADVCPQTEGTPHRPKTPYGISKSAGVHLCGYYRENFGLHTSAGILYNHESPRRSANFVTTQIVRAAAKAALGSPEPLKIRDLDAVVDWGAAQDYVIAMWQMLQQPRGDDFIIASGVPRTVLDFAVTAFNYVGLRAADFIFQEKKTNLTKSLPYVGDNSKIRQICEWKPSVSFVDLVTTMVDSHIQLYNNRQTTGNE